MALYNNKGRLSRKPFAKVPAVLDNLDEIEPPVTSVECSVASSKSMQRYPLPPSEPCFITQSILYTNEPTYWIKPGKNKTETRDIEDHIRELRVCGVNFLLNSGFNVTNLDCFIQKSLNTYPFIAVTGTHQTLMQLLDILQADCKRRQDRFNVGGVDPDRRLPFEDPAIQDPKYELVALYPEHFLPAGAFLTIFDRSAGTYKMYVPSSDRRLREAPGDLTCPPLPPFSGPARHDLYPLSPFLVILHAQIKFRRYLRQIEQNPPAKPLPDDVLALMKLTNSLADMIYWEPEIDENTRGGRIAMADRKHRYTNGEAPRSRWYPHEVLEWDERDDPRREDADLETRIAMGNALLFGDDSETDDDWPMRHQYSEDNPDSLEKVRSWQHGIVAS